MNICDISGDKLDEWVAKARGLRPSDDWLAGMHNGQFFVYDEFDGCLERMYYPSRSWEQAGPIIQYESIILMPCSFSGDNPTRWKAYIFVPSKPPSAHQFGKSPLEAAMRAYVAAEFGEEISSSPEW